MNFSTALRDRLPIVKFCIEIILSCFYCFVKEVKNNFPKQYFQSCTSKTQIICLQIAVAGEISIA